MVVQCCPLKKERKGYDYISLTQSSINLKPTTLLHLLLILFISFLSLLSTLKKHYQFLINKAIAEMNEHRLGRDFTWGSNSCHNVRSYQSWIYMYFQSSFMIVLLLFFYQRKAKDILATTQQWDISTCNINVVYIYNVHVILYNAIIIMGVYMYMQY